MLTKYQRIAYAYFLNKKKTSLNLSFQLRDPKEFPEMSSLWSKWWRSSRRFRFQRSLHFKVYQVAQALLCRIPNTHTHLITSLMFAITKNISLQLVCLFIEMSSHSARCSTECPPLMVLRHVSMSWNYCFTMSWGRIHPVRLFLIASFSWHRVLWSIFYLQQGKSFKTLLLLHTENKCEESRWKIMSFFSTMLGGRNITKKNLYLFYIFQQCQNSSLSEFDSC